MQKAIVIPLDPQRLPSMRFERLLELGVEACQQLSGDLWTDYNEHDPGRTILEQLCYAVTDLGYRLNYPVPDLLAGPGAGTHSPLYSGDRILCGAPLTDRDYRKYLYDQVHNLRNVWVSADGPGLLYIQAHAYDAAKAGLPGDLHDKYQAQRSLGEDLACKAAVLTPVKLELQGVLYVAADHVPGEVLPAALDAVRNMLSPAPAFTPVAEQLGAGVAPDTIFEGPLLAHGMLPDAELAGLRAGVTLREVRSALLATAGVAKVSALKLRRENGVVLDREDVPLPRGQGEVFELGPYSAALHVEWRDKRQRFDAATVQRQLDGLQHQAARREEHAERLHAALAYRQPPAGTDRDVIRYHSIQHQFPQVYGLGRYGIPDSAPPGEQIEQRANARRERVAGALRLSAYLMLFEQVLANHLAQMANLGRLFSLDRGQAQTYFSQPLVHFREWDGDAPNAPKVLPEAQDIPPAPAPAAMTVLVLARRSRQRAPGEVLLRSREVHSAGELAALESDILIHGRERQAWHVVQLRHGQFHLILRGPDHATLAFVQRTLRSRHAAERSAARLAGWLRLLATDPAARQRHLRRRSRGPYRLLLRGPDGAAMLVVRDLAQADLQDIRRALLLEGRFPERYELTAHGGLLRLRLGASAPYVHADGLRKLQGRAELEAERDACIEWLGRIACDSRLRDQALAIEPAPPDPAERLPARLHRYMSGLDQVVRRFDQVDERRASFLDHLLARVDEQFDDAGLASVDPRADQGALQRELNDWKSEFLRDYVPQQSPLEPPQRDVGASRNLGCDYTDQSMRTRSGLELRVRALLGIGAAQQDPGRRAWWHYGTGAAKPSMDKAFVFECDSPDALATLMRIGRVAGNIESASSPDRSGAWTISIREGEGERRVLRRCASEREATLAREELLAWLKDLENDPAALYADEDMVLVEHVLLRPRASAPTANTQTDPTRITLMLPDWPLRFQSPQFRQLLERTAAENCPAHLYLRCRWLDEARMATLRRLHEDWRSQLATSWKEPGPPLDAAAAHLADFIGGLDVEART